MRTKLYINFWLQPIKKSTDKYISCRITLENLGFCELSTGVRISPDQFENGRMITTGHRDKFEKEKAVRINRELDLIEHRLREIHYQLEKEGEKYMPADIKDLYKGKPEEKKRYTILEAMDAFLAEQQKRIDSTSQVHGGITKATFRTYQMRRANFETFLAFHLKAKDIYLDKLPVSLGDEFKNYLLKHHYDQQNKKHGISSDSAYKHLKMLYSVLDLAKKRRWVKDIQVETTQVHVKNYRDIPKIYLEPEERQMLESTVFNDLSLQAAADSFIFAYHAGGLAYTEQRNLNHEEHILTGVDGKTWLSIARQKTIRFKKMPVTVPLLPKALEIMEKYRDHPFCNEGNVLPVPSNVEYNRRLKTIAQICGIKKNLTTHVARKTFTTICAENEIPIEQTASMLGDDIKVVQKHYLWITDKMKARSMDRIAERLKNE